MVRVSLLAVVLVVLGSVGAAGAYGQVPALELTMIGPQWQLYQATAGAILVALGLATLLLDVLKRPDPKPSVDATSAFLAKPKAVPRPVPDAAAPVRRPAVAVGAPKDPELVRIESELAEVKRQINKAGVMLGTGQLSREGYAEYVAELKNRRGVLEAELVRLEVSRKVRGGA